MAHLPLSRTKTIMRTAVGADSVSKDAIMVTTRATELFIKMMAREGYKFASPAKKLQYNDIVKVVASHPRFEFLEMIIPKKITVKEYKELMKKKNSGDNQSSSSEETDTSDESESEEEEEKKEDVKGKKSKK